MAEGLPVGSLTVPVSADLGPITKDLEKLKRALDGIAGRRGGQSPFGELERATKNATRQTQSLTAALRPFATVLAGALSIRAVQGYADAWSDMQS